MKRKPTPSARCRSALPRHTRVVRCLVASLLGLLVLTACSAFDAIDYYWQSAAGEWWLLSSAQRIDDVIAGTNDQALKSRLVRIAEIRHFASTDLGLPTNGSYTRYTDLGRPFVTWTVIATPELSLEPSHWCFPVAGCVSYRGYFQEDAAHKEARRLEADGDDVYISSVPAYSTLGYFDDPVLSSFVNWPEPQVARLIFHELAHQLIYVPGDTLFNESYAVTVERAGLERWLAQGRDPSLVDQAVGDERAQAEFLQLVGHVRERLAAIYSSSASQAEKRAAKLNAFADLARAYAIDKLGNPGLARYQRWFSNRPNNASVAALAPYTNRVPAFEAILHEEGDLRRFYERVRQLAGMPKSDRDRILDRYGRAIKSPTLTHAARL